MAFLPYDLAQGPMANPADRSIVRIISLPPLASQKTGNDGIACEESTIYIPVMSSPFHIRITLHVKGKHLELSANSPNVRTPKESGDAPNPNVK